MARMTTGGVSGKAKQELKLRASSLSPGHAGPIESQMRVQRLGSGLPGTSHSFRELSRPAAGTRAT